MREDSVKNWKENRALACVVLVLLIWLYQSLKFRNRPLAVES